MRFVWDTQKFFGGVFVFLLILFGLNVVILRNLEKSLKTQPRMATDLSDMVSESSETLPARSPQLDQPLPEGLVPDQPEDFNITFENEQNLVRTQMQWDFELKRARDQAGHLRTSDPQERFVHVRKSPEEYASQLKLLDTQIKELEEKKRKSARNQVLRDRLQTLYMLRATLTIFKDEIIEEKSSQ